MTDAGVYIQLFLLQRQTSGVPGHSGASVSSEAGSTCFKVIVNWMHVYVLCVYPRSGGDPQSAGLTAFSKCYCCWQGLISDEVVS